jgi:hypothetical protein
MDALGFSNSAKGSDEYYRDQWISYYAERRGLLARMFWLDVGLGGCFLLFTSVVERHRPLENILAVPLTILLIALPAHWFIFVWRTRAWTCPRCGEYFFTSTPVNNPFGRRCRHCGLVRPKESEIEHFHYEEGRATPQ